jgi:predicted ATP-grasp superfamily ATP-dependent carboligase
VQLGNALAEAFDLQGLFGVDAIVADGEIWPVEVNPRFTASVEILERGLGIRSIALHVAACGGEMVSPPSVQPERFTSACCGKAILFAPRDIIVSPEFPAWCADQNKDSHWPAVADMPAGGTILRAGQPIVTVLAEGADEAAVIGKLRSLALLAVDEIADNQYAAADIDRRA